MTIQKHKYNARLAILILALVSACTLVASPTIQPSQTPPTATAFATATSRSTPTATNVVAASPAPTDTPTPIPTPGPCQRDVCYYNNWAVLQRPIVPPGNDVIEPSYRYGSTQNKQREVHHGVDITNHAGVPVLAAADGEVVFAGEDDQEVVGKFANFYGRAVIIQHILPGQLKPVFTLYGHLLQVMVKVGQRVHAGAQIGKVGLGGVAGGTHLHFEVRLAPNTYDSTRNPELWLSPRLDKNGKRMGALAGRILDAEGDAIEAADIVLKRLDGDRVDKTLMVYLNAYADPKMIGLPPWYENFASSDLPAGHYRLSINTGLGHDLVKEVQILPGQLTMLVATIE